MKKIKIVDSHYRFLCEVDDGKMLKVWKPGKESESIIRPCRYLDEYHFQYGGRTFHICQFGEWLEHEGYKAEPIGYFLDYKKYPSENIFGHKYYCLDKCKQAAFYYNPKEEYPFVVSYLDEVSRNRDGIPHIGTAFSEVVGYNASAAKWEIGFNMEKIKNIVYFNLPQPVIEADKMDLEAQMEQWEKKRDNLYEEYDKRGTLASEQQEKLMEEIYDLEHSHPDLWAEEEISSEYRGVIKNSHKVFARKDFAYCDFTGVDFTGYTFLYCEFENCTLEPENFQNAKILDCNLPDNFFNNKSDIGKKRGKSR